MNKKVCIQLNNIGIIQQSEIALEGLTIITGHNNSGKTTVGKALYAINSAVKDIEKEAEKDKCTFAKSELQKIREQCGSQDAIFLQLFGKKEEDIEVKNNILYAFFNQAPYFSSNSLQYIVHYIEQLIGVITEMKEEEYIGIIQRCIKDGKSVKDVEKNWLLKSLEKILEQLSYDAQLTNYSSKKIIKALRDEFNLQILPVKKSDAEGNIILTNNGSKCFEIDILNNNLKSYENNFIEKAYLNVTFVDDVFLIDNMHNASLSDESLYEYYRMTRNHKTDWNEYSKTKKHKDDLLEKLVQVTDNLFQEIINEKNANELLDKIDAVFPDEILLEKQEYICSSSKLNVKNLAAGSKLFAIIKKLLENAVLKEDTLLILDEPEAHLHPEWQNRFAEIIVLLVKCLEPHVLLTTHSPNFVMALEKYSKKHNIWNDKVNIYSTEHTANDYMVEYVDMKNSIEKIYGKLATPLFELKKMELRESDN